MTGLDDVEEWLDRAVANTDLTREELLARAVVALAERNDVDVPDPETVSELERRVERLDEGTDSASVTEDLEAVESEVASVEERLDRLESAVDDLDSEHDEAIEDLRERVVQVFREAESKAPEDHSHPALAGAVSDAESRLSALDDRLTDLEGRVDDRLSALDETLDAHEDLAEEVDGKLSKVAGAVVRLQRRVAALETESARRESLAELTAAANRQGIAKATCENCENAVRIALLAAPECPHCGEEFAGVEPKQGFFGTATLSVGDPPALEGDTAEPGELLENE